MDKVTLSGFIEYCVPRLKSSVDDSTSIDKNRLN